MSKPSHFIKIQFSDYCLKIVPHSENCIQVIASLEDVPARPNLMLIQQPEFSDWSVEKKGGKNIIRTQKIQLHVDTGTGRLEWFNSSGELLLREPEHARKLEVYDVKRYRFDPASCVTVIKTVDGERSTGVPTSEYIDRKAIRYEQAFELNSDEALYGLGQHEEGFFNLRNCVQYLFQANMKSPAPVILSTTGYGIFFETAAVSGFDARNDTMKFWSGCADSLNYYFCLGPDFDEIISSFRRLTGQASLLPRWAFGYIQSKERYDNAEELTAVGAEFRRRKIPLDCLVQDWKYWPNGWWGEKSFDPERFPDPNRMLDDLHEMNIRLMISIWPNMRNDGPNQKQFRDSSYLLGDNSSYNAFDESARKLYWEQVDSGIFQHGIDAWWCDSTEPFNNEWEGADKPDVNERLQLVEESFNYYLDPADANAYPLAHARGIYEGQRMKGSQKRIFNLTRSSFPGQQKYGCVIWSGDISARWDVLRSQIAEGLNFCASGIPYWTTDIGAFFTGGHECYKRWSDNNEVDPVWFWKGDYDDGVFDLGYQELYLRWLQWATFLPIMRSHGTDTPREPWNFGDCGNPIYDSIVKFIRLRYRLIPYLYSLAGRQTHRDYTMMRLLAFDFREDDKVYDISDQYMLGPSLLVCPVTEPFRYGPKSEVIEGKSEVRSVYLPEGSDWYDFWTDQRYVGGQTIQAACPLEQIPVYVKAGSILPLGSPIEHTGQEQQVEWSVYPGADAEFEYYQDAGDDYSYENGEFEMNPIRWCDRTRKISWADLSPMPYRVINTDGNHKKMDPKHANYCDILHI